MAIDRGQAPFYLRRTKEAMVYFPERQPNGAWVARKIFTQRIPHTVEFQIDGAEFALYQDITRFVKRQSARAAAQSDDPRARAVGFLMALYQRRLASSPYAVRRSLHNRARRLQEGLQRAQTLARQAPPVLPDPDELEEMEEGERDRLERLLEAITLAGNAEQVHEEIAELRHLAQQAHEVEEASTEAKLARLKDLLHTESFFDDPEQRLLLFTEFKDTLDYLVDYLQAWGFRVGTIHGGMKPGSRDDPGTRLCTEQQFKDGAIQILVATEAAGEGINLQCCHILFNYDITSLDLNSGELRLIEVKGLGAATGSILLTPDERRVAEDRRDCYWLYVVTNCNDTPQLQAPIKDPARFPVARGHPSPALLAGGGHVDAVDAGAGRGFAVWRERRWVGKGRLINRF
jgi:SNF2 family DNA or RNA helicase